MFVIYDYFCLFDFQLNGITIKLYQLFEHLTMMTDDQINILTSRQDVVSYDLIEFYLTQPLSRLTQATARIFGCDKSPTALSYCPSAT